MISFSFGLRYADYVNQLPLFIGNLDFDWWVVWRGSKKKHHKCACVKEIGLHVSISIVNNEHNKEDLCIS